MIIGTSIEGGIARIPIVELLPDAAGAYAMKVFQQVRGSVDMARMCLAS